MSLSVTVLGSGSSGNAVLIKGDDGALLIDAGFSARKVEKKMSRAGTSPDELKAILVSHEHGDHVKAVGTLSKRYGLPVYGVRECIMAAKLESRLKDFVPIEPGRAFTAVGMEVAPFSVPHDAVEPLGFIVKNGTCRVGVATDLGYVSGLVKQKLSECQAVVLEANHDMEMLKYGPYPWELKQRVMSRYGHLSNDGMAEALPHIVRGGTKYLLLAHISRKNNLPDLALAAARDSLDISGGRAEVFLTSQDEINEEIIL